MIRIAMFFLAGFFLLMPGRPVYAEDAAGEMQNAVLQQTFYEDGKVMTEDRIEDGRMVSRRFFPGGQAQTETVRLNDTDNETRTYFESGALEGESMESASKQSLKEYDEKGTLRKEIIMEGERRTDRVFREDGSLESEDSEGVHREFGGSGKLKFEETLENGSGTRTVYSESGAKSEEVRLEKGEAVHFKVYDGEGKVAFDGPLNDYLAKYYPQNNGSVSAEDSAGVSD